MKRFYKVVSIDVCDGGYSVCLDGRPVKTESKAVLCAPNKEIAHYVMQEWNDQKEEIIPDDMPFTQILNTKIDRVLKERDVITSNLLKYLDTDLICYQVSQPPALAKLQDEKRAPWLQWFAQTFGTDLKTTTGLSALQQSAQAHKAVKEYIVNLDDDRFTVLQIITSVSGSIILALAFLHQEIETQEIFDACFMEELFKDTLYNAEKYGSDPILEKKQKAAMFDFRSSSEYLRLL